jgi:hypothetical protein
MTEPGYFSPELPDLLATVRDFIRNLTPRLAKGDVYQAQVASYLLEMALRELDAGAASTAHSAQRMSAALGVQGDAHSLNWKLCGAIRAGEFDQRWDEILQLLLDDYIERAAIVRPDYPAPEHRPAAPAQADHHSTRPTKT